MSVLRGARYRRALAVALFALGVAVCLLLKTLLCRVHFRQQHFSRQSPGSVARVTDFYHSLGPYSSLAFVNDAPTRQLCAQLRPDRLSALFLVKSHPRNHLRRDVIRRTYKQAMLMDIHVDIVVAFLVGHVTDGSAMGHQLAEEAAHNGDLISPALNESYETITLKTLSGMQWFVEHCPKARLYASVDDDTFLHAENQIRFMASTLRRKLHEAVSFVGCDWEEAPVILRSQLHLCYSCSKWCVDQREFPQRSHYPVFCHGYYYIMPHWLVQQVFQLALRYGLYRMDDVFVSGLILAEIDNVQKMQLRHRLGYSSLRQATEHNQALGHCADSVDDFLWRWRNRAKLPQSDSSRE